GLARDAVDAVCQNKRVIVHRRQAASHGSMLVMLTASAAAYDALHTLPHYFPSATAHSVFRTPIAVRFGIPDNPLPSNTPHPDKTPLISVS
ncbi:hypothetical protein NRB14_12530, partial [Pseudomonas viridiflava]|uniref:hypothetical protein n=1 Tax=Pseudomonas viridiflava TaxID=33069 RepID=UPI00211D483A